MKTPPAEIIDRYSILILKKRYTNEVDKEYRLYKKAYGKLLKKGILPFYLSALMEINEKIWQLESDIRREAELPLEEIGRRTLKIRDYNKERIRYKNIITEDFGGFKEIKINHRSE